MFRSAETARALPRHTAILRNGRRAWCAIRKDTLGTAAIEFAFVIGVVVLVVIAAVQFGNALMARNQMNHALAVVVREVQLHPTTTTSTEIEAQLEDLLQDSTGADAEVSVTAISGTSYMRIAVAFPFQISLPFMPDQELNIGVETLAPMVSPTQ